MKKVIVVMGLLLCSCVKRVSIPCTEGYIYDSHTFTPLKGVKVSIGPQEYVLSDSIGYFFIEPVFYYEIVSIGGEAPPVICDMKVSKAKYNDTIIEYRNKYGGSNANLKVKYDSILLKPIDNRK